MAFLDERKIRCVDCGERFACSPGDLAYDDKRRNKIPRLCKICMAVRHSAKRGIVQAYVRCAACGRDTMVSFIPRTDETMLCRECFRNPSVIPIHHARLQ